MRYIKTKDGIYEFRELVGFETYLVAKSNEDSASLYQIEQKDIINKSDIIEELFDEFVLDGMLGIIFVSLKLCLAFMEERKMKRDVYGSIRTEKGIIYVAKMKDVLPNGEIDWELLCIK